ncbi:unnamed protein product [Boreogadus saida]
MRTYSLEERGNEMRKRGQQPGLACTTAAQEGSEHQVVHRQAEPSDLRKHRRKRRLDEDGQDKATIKCETSPPPTPRTVRMTHTLPSVIAQRRKGVSSVRRTQWTPRRGFSSNTSDLL